MTRSLMYLPCRRLNRSLGYSRSKLQERLGLPVAGSCNYFVYCPLAFICVGKCALCQV
jgi:hypothetical protein